MIYYLMGKSASGKDTIYKRLKEADPRLQEVVLYSTRPIRAGETDGVEYHFVSVQELEALEAEGKVIERRTYQTVCGPWTYATVDDGQIVPDQKEIRYLMMGTLESYRRIRDYYGADYVMPVYIEVPDELRRERAEERERRQQEPRFDELERRFAADEMDFSEENIRGCGIEKRYQNIEMEACLNEILADTRQ